MSNSVYIRAHVTADEAERLRLAIERGHRSRQWLAGQIIRAWLNNPARQIATAERGTPAELAALSPAQRAGVRRRERTLKRWQATVAKGVRRGSKINDLTAAFVLSLSDEDRVGRATLYIWQRRYQGAGIGGLIDGRAVPLERDSRGATGRKKRAV